MLNIAIVVFDSDVDRDITGHVENGCNTYDAVI